MVRPLPFVASSEVGFGMRPKLNNSLRNCLLVVVCTAIPLPAIAAQSGINFGGTVGLRNYCQVVLVEGGVLAQSGDQKELSSEQAGGVAGRAQITTTRGRYRVSIDAPTGFSSMPPDGDTNVDFSSAYSLTGATTATRRNGARSTRLGRGRTDLAAHFSARRVVGSFPAGSYSSVLTVRCE